MKYLRILIGAVLIAMPLYFCLLFMQGGASEEQLLVNHGSQMEGLAEEAKQRLLMEKNIVIGAIKILAADKDYSAKLKEYYSLSNGKKPTDRQAERLSQLQEELLAGPGKILGFGLDVSLVSAAGQVLLASEKAPYPVGTDIKHTTIFKNVRSGYLFNDVEIGYNNQAVTIAAMPIATADGAMALLLTFPLEQVADSLLKGNYNHQQMSWVISVGNKIVSQGGSLKLRKAPALSDKVTVYGNSDTDEAAPKLLAHPEMCGQISVAVAILGNVPEMAMGFVLDTSPTYAPISDSQRWALIGALMAAIIFIIFTFISDWRSHKAMERLCDHLSLVVKGAKTGGDLSAAHFHDDLKRIVVLVNKVIGQMNSSQRNAAIAPLVPTSQTLKDMLTNTPAEPIAVPGLSSQGVNNPTNKAFGAVINEEESTIPGVESALDMGIIDQITDDMQDAQKEAQAAAAAMPISDKEMMGALDALEPLSMGQENTDVNGVFMPEDNNRSSDEFNSISSLYNEQTYSAVPLPPLNMPEEALDMGEMMPPLAATPEAIPDSIDAQLDMAALEAQAAQVDDDSHQNSTVIMPMSMINEALAATHRAPTVPVDEPPPSAAPAFPDVGSLPEHTQMGPIPTAALLEMAKSQTAKPAAPVNSEETLFKAVFEDYKRVRQECGESISELNYAKFAQKLRDTKAKVLATHNCRDVRFSVQAKNGKATLKAAPVK